MRKFALRFVAVAALVAGLVPGAAGVARADTGAGVALVAQPAPADGHADRDQVAGAPGPCVGRWVCLYDGTRYRGDKWQYLSCCAEQPLDAFRADNRVDSVINQLPNDVILRDWGSGEQVCVDGYSRQPNLDRLLPDFRNKADSVQITGSTTLC